MSSNVNIDEDALNKRAEERFVRKTARISAKYLRNVREMNNVPKSMAPFWNVLEDVYVNNKKIFEESAAETVGTYCVMVPEELVYAAGGKPVRICSGNHVALQLGEEILPKDACPLVKAAAGSIMPNSMAYLGNCKYSVIPVTCDCKRKLVDKLKEFHAVHSMRIPSASQDDGSIEEYVTELYKLKDFLEENLGEKITYKKLHDAIGETYATALETERFFRLKSCFPSVIHGIHSIMLFNAYTYMRPEEWRRHLSVLNDELEKRIESGVSAARKNTPRIMLTGSPMIFPNVKIPYIIESSGGVVVADETCIGERGYSDVPVINDCSMDGLMQALAVKAIRPCTCPVFVDTDKRLYRIKKLIERNQVDGVIYHVLRGCLVYDYEYQTIEDMLESMGVKVLRVETDYSEEDVEQLKIRLEAFLEVIKFSK